MGAVSRMLDMAPGRPRVTSWGLVTRTPDASMGRRPPWLATTALPEGRVSTYVPGPWDLMGWTRTGAPEEVGWSSSVPGRMPAMGVPPARTSCWPIMLGTTPRSTLPGAVALAASSSSVKSMTPAPPGRGAAPGWTPPTGRTGARGAPRPGEETTPVPRCWSMRLRTVGARACKVKKQGYNHADSSISVRLWTQSEYKDCFSRYRNSHYEDKLESRPSRCLSGKLWYLQDNCWRYHNLPLGQRYYFYNRNSFSGKTTSLYWDGSWYFHCVSNKENTVLCSYWLTQSCCTIYIFKRF